MIAKCSSKMFLLLTQNFKYYLSCLYYYIHPAVKWFLRRTTGLCELQRICYGAPEGAPRNFSVERSLLQSRSKEIQAAVAYLNRTSKERQFKGNKLEFALQYIVETVLVVKKINALAHPKFPILLRQSVEVVWGYNQLEQEIVCLAGTHFDSSNKDHEAKLMELWSLLKPDAPLRSRVTKQWQEIGFQGTDPKTDFRGMGVLGLENLLYFASKYNSSAKQVLAHSHHPQFGYAFAIVGINLTSMAYHLMTEKFAKTHMYNVCSKLPSIDSFHLLYCYLFVEFDKFWIQARPKDIMEFSHIRENFETKIRKILSSNQRAAFKVQVSNDLSI
ncbi:unnamed protein product [Bemisia tabaci]|uniref:ELMO domain-containing protein n=1 Tax=Bemisia tabaci TaxID=7038 RepID=A0A9P0AM54_BEMTA|nr:PREDICTED: ELMO domain-containing protein 2 [Bemisia tabaci]CAH0394739.1 unnamed protein product [Bemisia tabaci]